MTRALAPAARAVVIVVCATALWHCGLEPEGARSGIEILVDFSRSFAPLTPQDGTRLATLGAAGVSIAQQIRQPVKVLWAAISEDSRRAPVLCEGPRLFQEDLGLHKPPPGQFSKEAELQKWAGAACPDVVVQSSTPATPYTDLYGAVNFAAESMNAVSGQKFLFIYSDMLHDKPGPPEALKTLADYRVLIAWRPGLDSVVGVDARLRKWADELKAAGVSKVCVQPAAGLLAVDVVSCLGPYDVAR